MPDYRVRVVEQNAFWTIVKADSYEDAINAVQRAMDEVEHGDIIDDLPFHEEGASLETDGAREVENWPQDEIDMHQHELISDPNLDTASSASRQHWIDTGLYLTKAETDKPLQEIVRTQQIEHDARPDNDSEPGDRCKDCGRDITWMGPGRYDWEHVA